MLLERCTRVREDGEDVPITGVRKAALAEAIEDIAASGRRTLAFAMRGVGDFIPWDENQIENELTWVGMVGIVDVPRPEVKDAIGVAAEAGIDVVMVTGDTCAGAAAMDPT